VRPEVYERLYDCASASGEAVHAAGFSGMKGCMTARATIAGISAAVVSGAILLGGCGRPAHLPAVSRSKKVDMATMDLQFLTRKGCVNTPAMKASLELALARLGRRREFSIIDADSLPESDPRRSYGTPTVLLNGGDLFGKPRPATAAGLT